jgi:hypothetical protein
MVGSVAQVVEHNPQSHQKKKGKEKKKAICPTLKNC